MADRKDVNLLNPNQPESVCMGAGTLGVYRSGFRYRKESLQFYEDRAGTDVFRAAMNSDAGRAHHFAAARAFLNQADWEKFVWIEEFGSLDGFPGY